MAVARRLVEGLVREEAEEMPGSTSTGL